MQMQENAMRGERGDKIIIQITVEGSTAVVVGTLNRKYVIRLLFKLCLRALYFIYIHLSLSAIQFECFRTFHAFLCWILFALWCFMDFCEQ